MIVVVGGATGATFAQLGAKREKVRSEKWQLRDERASVCTLLGDTFSAHHTAICTLQSVLQAPSL